MHNRLVSDKSPPKRFVGLWDIHFGHERRNRHKLPIHNPRALAPILKFLDVFQPHHLIWGGDILDCGAISHHNKNNRRAVEGLRLLEDAKLAAAWMQEARTRCAPGVSEALILGNHEDWLEDLIDDYPGLEGVLSVEALLSLPASCRVVNQGGSYHLGKLWFLHGDQFKGGGSNVAKKAVDTYGANVRFGHFHKYEAFTKFAAVDATDVKTGIAVPGLCTRGPKYLEGAPNQWSNGFLWGYIHPDGTFTDYVSIIVNGRFSALGQTFR